MRSPASQALMLGLISRYDADEPRVALASYACAEVQSAQKKSSSLAYPSHQLAAGRERGIQSRIFRPR